MTMQKTCLGCLTISYVMNPSINPTKSKNSKGYIDTGRAPARIRQRSIIVTDDGIATGASMIAALQAIRHKEPIEIIVAVPLAGVEQIDKVSRWCDEVVCIERLPYAEAVKDYYHDFPAVPDSCVVELLSRSRTEIVPDFQIRSHCPVAPPIGVMSEKDWSK